MRFQGALERNGRNLNSAVHGLAAAYIPSDAAVGIFEALHFPEELHGYGGGRRAIE